MTILAIETSCDESGLALVEATGGTAARGTPKFKVLASLIASQIKIHRPFGGVVPNLAKREHLKNLPILYKKLFKAPATEKRLWAKIDRIAVTSGPGLEPALWAGINFAQELAKAHKKLLLGANHMEGHLYSFLLPKGVSASTKGKKTGAKTGVVAQAAVHFPAVALIVSGGHTILLLMKDLKTWKQLGETRDDAVGEAFDKVARMLELPYPGGPEIEKAAHQGNPRAVHFPRPMMHEKNYEFSFSGIKTSVLYYLRDLRLQQELTPEVKADMAASFQAACVDVLTYKTFKAAREFGAKSVILAGGVAANKALRQALAQGAKENGLQLFVPEFQFNTDNAAMIAAGSYMSTLRGKKYKLVANGSLGM